MSDSPLSLEMLAVAMAIIVVLVIAGVGMILLAKRRGQKGSEPEG